MVDQTSMRLVTGAAATIAFVIMMSIFVMQGVPKDEVFKGLQPNTVEYYAREQFYYEMVGVKVKEGDHYVFKKNADGSIVTQGKVTRLQLFLEDAKKQFNDRSFKLF